MTAFPVHFDLPPERIAQHPCEPRDQARLLVARRADHGLEHRRIADLPSLLESGDLLVFNDTRVVAARLFGIREATGGKWDGLFLRALPDGAWHMLFQTRGRLREGEWLRVAPELRLEIVEKLPEGVFRVRPQTGDAATTPLLDWPEVLERHGHTPLPHYIRKGHASGEDRSRYQTVYAREPGAVAAPTAGLHFTRELMGRLKDMGVVEAFVTLHVGLGTFRPIEAADYREHRMHAERGRVSAETVSAISATKQQGGRVIAVGTTTVRVLESAARAGPLEAWSGETDIFIHPPFPFRVIDALLTNFHLPRSTLLLLVSAFGGAELLQKAYDEALRQGYRFYSYGDAMFIV